MTYQGATDAVYFNRDDVLLVGAMYTANGSEPRPAAILLHGIPGAEKNNDLAYRLRENGWHVLVLSFSGSWGSGGDYDITLQPADVRAAIDYLTTLNAPYRIDSQRITVIGYSLGSRAAFVSAYQDERVFAVVSISGIGDFDEIMLSTDFYSRVTPLLRNATPERLKVQWQQLGGDLNPIQIIGNLKQPLLIIHGDQDETIPFWMSSSLHDASAKRASYHIIQGANHDYTEHRQQLVETVVGWLTAL